MTDRDAFLRAIAEAPDDDAPRLVFADWLDERAGRKSAADRAWAAYIRRCVDLARLPRTDPGHWTARTNPWPVPPAGVRGLLPAKVRQFAVFDRGFPDGLSLSLRKFNLVVPHLTGCTAPLRKLTLSQGGGSLPDALRREELSLFRELRFNNVHPRDEGAAALAASPHLANLTRLHVGDRVGVGGVTAVANSPHLADVRELDLGYGSYGDAGVLAVADSPMADRLERLTVSTERTSAGLAATAASPRLTRLRNFGGRGDDDEWLRPITDGGLPALEDLAAGFPTGAGDALAAFLRSPRFRSLTALTLWGRVPASAWEGLPADPGPASLRLVYEASDRAAAAFVRSPALGRCVDLRLTCRGMTPADVEALASSPYAAGLRYLTLPGERVEPSVAGRAIEALATSPHLTGLVGLDLGGFLPDDDGIHALCEASFAGSLRALTWWGDHVSVAAVVERFVTRPAFPNLVALRAGEHWASGALADHLTPRYPGGRYDW